MTEQIDKTSHMYNKNLTDIACQQAVQEAMRGGCRSTELYRLICKETRDELGSGVVSDTREKNQGLASESHLTWWNEQFGL